MYVEGQGVARDYVQAFKWFAAAAARGSDSYARTNAEKGRDYVAARMIAVQLAEAQRLSRGWKAKPDVCVWHVSEMPAVARRDNEAGNIIGYRQAAHRIDDVR